MQLNDVNAFGRVGGWNVGGIYVRGKLKWVAARCLPQDPKCCIQGLVANTKRSIIQMLATRRCVQLARVILLTMVENTYLGV
jgi:hypothetical protein